MNELDYNALFFENEKLVPYIFNRYYKDLRYMEEDLLQSGRLGLWKACTQYDPSKKTKFSVFAYRCIKNEMGQYANKEIKYKKICGEGDVEEIIDDDVPDYDEVEHIVKDSDFKEELIELYKGKSIKQIHKTSKHTELPYHKLVRRIRREEKKIRKKYEGTDSL